MEAIKKKTRRNETGLADLIWGFAGHLGNRCEFVEGRGLQSILQGKSDVLVAKIDVEGYEEKVVRGMRAWLEEAGPCYLFVEIFPSLQTMHDASS
eukprot:1837646-Rhodomonas_salina.2